MFRHLKRLTLATVALALVASTAGCTLFGGDPELTTVSDAGGLFHIKIPATWSSQAQTGLIAIYGAEEPPASDTLKDLSIGIFSTQDTTDTPVPEALTYVVNTRAVERSWSDATVGEPTDAKIGGRDGAVIAVSGTDAQGIKFKAEYYFVRTSGHEVLVIAAAPADTWAEVEDEVHALVADEWYWQIAEQAEDTSTAQ